LNNNIEPVFEFSEVQTDNNKVRKLLYCKFLRNTTLYTNSPLDYLNSRDADHQLHHTRDLFVDQYRIKFITFDGDVLYSYFDPYNQYVINFFRGKNYKEIVCEEVNRIYISAQDNINEDHSVEPSPANLDFTTYFSRDYTVIVQVPDPDNEHGFGIGERRWFKSIFNAPELISLYSHLLTNEIQDIGYFVIPPVPSESYIDGDFGDNPWYNDPDYKHFPYVGCYKGNHFLAYSIFEEGGK